MIGLVWEFSLFLICWISSIFIGTAFSLFSFLRACSKCVRTFFCLYVCAIIMKWSTKEAIWRKSLCTIAVTDDIVKLTLHLCRFIRGGLKFSVAHCVVVQSFFSFVGVVICHKSDFLSVINIMSSMNRASVVTKCQMSGTLHITNMCGIVSIRDWIVELNHNFHYLVTLIAKMSNVPHYTQSTKEGNWFWRWSEDSTFTHTSASDILY